MSDKIKRNPDPSQTWGKVARQSRIGRGERGAIFGLFFCEVAPLSLTLRPLAPPPVALHLYRSVHPISVEIRASIATSRRRLPRPYCPSTRRNQSAIGRPVCGGAEP